MKNWQTTQSKSDLFSRLNGTSTQDDNYGACFAQKATMRHLLIAFEKLHLRWEYASLRRLIACAFTSRDLQKLLRKKADLFINKWAKNVNNVTLETFLSHQRPQSDTKPENAPCPASSWRRGARGREKKVGYFCRPAVPGLWSGEARCFEGSRKWQRGAQRKAGGRWDLTQLWERRSGQRVRAAWNHGGQ